MGAAGTLHRIWRGLLALALLAWLLWVGALSGSQLFADLRAHPGTWRGAFEATPEQRRVRTMNLRDERIGEARGTLNAIIDALLTEVPAHETVYVIGVQTKEQAQVLVPVPHLCFPRRLEPLQPARARDIELIGASYVLCFDAGLEPVYRANKELLASGPAWTLWR